MNYFKFSLTITIFTFFTISMPMDIRNSSKITNDRAVTICKEVIINPSHNTGALYRFLEREAKNDISKTFLLISRLIEDGQIKKDKMEDLIFNAVKKNNKTIFHALANNLSDQNINMQDSAGNTLLHKAIIHERASITRFLYTKYIDPNILNKDQKTAKELAPKIRHYPHVVYVNELERYKQDYKDHNIFVSRLFISLLLEKAIRDHKVVMVDPLMLCEEINKYF